MQGYRQEYESPRLNSRGIRAESSEASLHPPTPKATEGQAILRLLLRQGYARPSEVLTKEGRTRRLRKGLLSHPSTASCPSITLVTEERPWSSAKEDKSSVFSLSVFEEKKICTEVSAVGADINPDTILTKKEKKILTTHKFEKRRREWLAGRLAAKLLLNRFFQLKPLNCEILRDENGKPYTLKGGEKIFLSISHSHDWAAASAACDGRYLIGMDIEKIQYRPRAWLHDFFHTEEYSEDVSTQTFIWSSKESLLKALGIGLTASLLDIKLKMSNPKLGAFELADSDIEFSGKARERFTQLGRPKLQIFGKLIKKEYAQTWAINL